MECITRTVTDQQDFVDFRSVRGTSAAEYEARLRRLYTIKTVQVCLEKTSNGNDMHWSGMWARIQAVLIRISKLSLAYFLLNRNWCVRLFVNQFSQCRSLWTFTNRF